MGDDGPDAVKAVVFDIGGVLLDWRPERVYLDLLPDPAERAWFLANVCTPEWNATLDAGRPFDEACTELAARFPAYTEAIHAWKRQADMIAGEVPGTAAIVAELEQAGVPLYLLTNMPADVFAQRRARYPVLQRFAGAVASGEEGVCKPARAIFATLLERYALDAPATLFIDDAEVNVRGARAVGLQAHRFVGAATLRAVLVRRGVLASGDSGT